jgi:hypothetical protein
MTCEIKEQFGPLSHSKIMKTKITMIAAFAVLSAGAMAAPAASGVAQTVEAIAADEKTVTLEVSGLK